MFGSSRSTATRHGLLAFVLAGAGCATAGVALTVAGSASAAGCSAVDVSFARGTGEAQGLGSVGTPFVNAVTSALPGRTVSSYAVVYDANTAQTSAAPGSTDLTNHITSVAASCPATVFIVGGYSQGATVVDKSLGITTGSGGNTPIPAALSGRVAAAVVFGNPLGLQGQTIATASATYGARSRDYCNTGDPVCGNGSNIGAHLQYASNGSAAAGGQFAASLVGSTPAPSPTTTAPTTAPTSPTAAPTSPTAAPTSSTAAPTSSPVSGTCVTASNRSHVAAGRATDFYGRAYAIGTRDSLGADNSFTTTTLKQNSATSWSRVSSC